MLVNHADFDSVFSRPAVRGVRQGRQTLCEPFGNPGIPLAGAQPAANIPLVLPAEHSACEHIAQVAVKPVKVSGQEVGNVPVALVLS